MEIRPVLWHAVLIGMALLTALPILAVFGYVFVPAPEVWRHLAQTVLPDYLYNTVLLVLGVGFGVLLLGLPATWLNSMCRFPG